MKITHQGCLQITQKWKYYFPLSSEGNENISEDPGMLEIKPYLSCPSAGQQGCIQAVWCEE
jgi:hypothetical protein